MASSPVEICNSALLKLGAERIATFLENNKRARLCSERYDGLRKEVLRAHPWNFAIKRASLNQLVSTPEFEYSFEYQLPADCLRVIKTQEEGSAGNIILVQAIGGNHLEFGGGLSSVPHFKIEGRKLVTNSTAVKILYIKDEEDTTLFDPSFDDALAARIAAEFAYALVQSNSLQANMFALYESSLAKAKTRDGQEGSPDDLQADFFVNARF